MKIGSPEHLEMLEKTITKGLQAQMDLDGLRLSVARLAQLLGISAKEIPAHSFFGAPNTSERGWNRLIAICMNYLEDEYGIKQPTTEK